MSPKPIIGIIGGRGRFGGWFKGFFENQGLTVLIAGRKTLLTPKELAQKADIVIVCVPIPITVETIKEVRDFVRPDALLCDFTSVKSRPFKEMLKAKNGCGVSAIHPLFGPLVPSINKQAVVFCSGRDNNWTQFLKKIFEKNGATIISSDPETHDRQMAMIQALTHFINITFAKTIQQQKLKPLNVCSTPIFRLQSVLAGRVLGGNPELYADLEIENPYFPKILDDYLKETKKNISYVKKKNKKGFVQNFNKIASFMKDFIPVAQTKTLEIISFMDRQPIELKQNSRQIKFKKGAKIAYLGPEGTFSHQAALAVFTKDCRLVPCTTITQVFDKVLNGEAALGVAPAENSTEGMIQETLDNLVKYPLRVAGAYDLPIHLCLLGRTADLKKIKIIKSHSQPIAQCRNWLAQNLLGIPWEIESSSTKAILSTENPDVAFIASRQAAKQYGLKILAENIEDKKHNVTQFYILAKGAVPQLSKILEVKKTLLLLAVYDRVGVLKDILNELADRQLNLSKLHSKTSEAEGWDYYFFLEIETSPANPRLKEALRAIKQYCSIVRVLGMT